MTIMRRQLLVIQAAIGASVLLYLLLGYYSRRPDVEPSEMLNWLKPALLGLTVILFPVLRGLQRRWLPAFREVAPGPQREAAQRVFFSRSILLFALAELPGVSGLVLALLGAPLRTLFLCCGLSLFYLAILTPPAELG